MITINGIKLIAKSGFSQRNIIVLSTTLAMGMGLGTAAPESYGQMNTLFQYLFKDSVATVCIIGIVMNIIFPPDPEQHKESVVIEVD
jgi:Xanthine/uracil permeases